MDSCTAQQPTVLSRITELEKSVSELRQTIFQGVGVPPSDEKTASPNKVSENVFDTQMDWLLRIRNGVDEASAYLQREFIAKVK